MKNHNKPILINSLKYIFLHNYLSFLGENRTKSNVKSKVLVLFTLGIIFALSPIIINTNLNSNVGINNKTSVSGDNFTLDSRNLKIAATSGKIAISGDSGWNDAKTAGICTGSGTSIDPYIIEDLVIDGESSGSCISISSSNIYFKIENCTLYNSGGNDGDAGILLLNVRNGQLLNNSASNNWVGIHLHYCE
ncbi:MAG: hypothetical protein ACTSQL_07400, partial [Promethearchaeota archaeon]